MKFLLTNKLLLAGIIGGAVAGYIYYCSVGCVTGTCPISSQPLNSTFYGAMMGGLAANIFKGKPTNPPS
jgi:phage shock protein E